MRTHNVFGFALSLLVVEAWLYNYFLIAIFTSILLTLSINWFIDRIAGHKGYRRAPYTHSFITSTVIAVAIAMLYIYALDFLGVTVPVQQVFAASICVAVSHMLLDMMTKDGIYPIWPLAGNKLSILGVRYDNPAINTLFVVISIAIILAILLT